MKGVREGSGGVGSGRRVNYLVDPRVDCVNTQKNPWHAGARLYGLLDVVVLGQLVVWSLCATDAWPSVIYSRLPVSAV